MFVRLILQYLFFSFPSTRNVPAGHSALSPPPYDFGLMFLSSQVSNYFLILVLVTSDNRKSPKILASHVPQSIQSANQYSNQMHWASVMRGNTIQFWLVDKVTCYFWTNRPFLSSKITHFQNEARCKAFVVKMCFICMRVNNHFHINSFALRLALKERLEATLNQGNIRS